MFQSYRGKQWKFWAFISFLPWCRWEWQDEWKYTTSLGIKCTTNIQWYNIGMWPQLSQPTSFIIWWYSKNGHNYQWYVRYVPIHFKHTINKLHSQCFIILTILSWWRWEFFKMSYFLPVYQDWVVVEEAGLEARYSRQILAWPG